MPAVTRFGDADVSHCSSMTRKDHSDTVIVNGLGVSYQGCKNTDHMKTGAPCTLHAEEITIGSTTVFVHGKGIGRVGDAITDCTFVAQGSSDVFAGG